MRIASLACLLAFTMLCACAGATPSPAPLPMPGPAPAPAPTPDPLASLATFTVNDLTLADGDAVAHSDNIAHMCYPSLVKFIQSLPSATGTTVAGAFGAFQKARDLRNAVSGGVPDYVLIGCGPLVTQVRGDILTILGRLGAGVVAAPLVPVVPLP